MHFIQYLLTSKAAHALLWTLVHSLWQGILIALAAALLIAATKNSTAAIRYKLLAYLMCVFAFISVATFCYELNVAADSNLNDQSAINALNNYDVNTTIYNPFKSFITKAVLLLQAYENFIVFIWMIIVTAKCLRMLTGLRTVYLLKHRHVFEVEKFWNDKLKELTIKVGITKPVTLLKSAIAEIPMMTGHFKPVILFPAAALTNLPVEDIEAVLLHELAHIRRNDYLLSMLQGMVEIIFFFNPAVLWLSSLIKEERENCCDDIALHQTKDKKQFVHALVAFQQCNTAIKNASFFTGRRYHLLNRLKRIITNNNKTLNTMEKSLLTVGIIITAFTALAFTRFKQPFFANTGHVMQHVRPDFFADKKDTTEPIEINNNESETVISNSINGKHYKLIEINGKAELYVNGIKIPDDRIEEYKDVITKLKQQLADDKKKQTEAMKAQAEALDKQAKSMKENDLAMEAQAADLNAQAHALNDSDINENMQAENDARAQSEDLNNQALELRAQAEVLQKQASDMKSEASENNNAEDREAYKAQADELQKQASEMRAETKTQSVEMHKQLLKAQADYLKQQNLLTKAQLDKQMQQMKIQQKQLAEQSVIMKQQQLQMKAEMVKQAEVMKQQQLQMKADMEKQIEQLKEQREELKRDSINQSKLIKPNN